MKNQLRRITIDIDSHSIMRLFKVYFNAGHMLSEQLVSTRVDRTRRGYHIIFTAYCSEKTYWEIRQMFDDQTRLEFDRSRHEKYPSHTDVLWSRKNGHEVFKDVDVLLGSGFAVE